MAFRLVRIEQRKELGVRPARGVQFGEAFLCELLGGQCGKAEVKPRIVVVVQQTQLCENATEVYAAPVMECEVESAFLFKVCDCDKAGLPEGSGIDLGKIEMMGVGELRVRVGRMAVRDLWRLDEGLKDLFGVEDIGE